MLPSSLITQLQTGMADFLHASFWSSTPAFRHVIDDLVSTPGELFQGPFVSLKLPFERGAGDGTYFPDVPMGFPPHAHQEAAFERLGGDPRQNTIVATGTGSGKTECFMMPILDHCLKHASENGIKAILLYPMNALAEDQAQRFGEQIWQSPKLRGYVNVGMYVGGVEETPHTTMGPTHVVTDRNTIRKHPPDILLTNYKMLDYLLLRPGDRLLWRENGPGTLQFLVVDELHTFDGAQGTDLACLIRRLKSRLKTPGGHLCCVGTSATLGGDGSARAASKPEPGSERTRLVEYASEIFGEPFDESNIVEEARQSVGEFLGAALIEHVSLVPPDYMDHLRPERYLDGDAYVCAQVELWFPDAGLVQSVDTQPCDDPESQKEKTHDDSSSGQGSGEKSGESVEPGEDKALVSKKLDEIGLGEVLKSHAFFQNLLKVLDGRVMSVDGIVDAFQKNKAFRGEEGREYGRLLVTSMLAMASAARGEFSGQVAGEKAGESGDESAGVDKTPPRRLPPFVQVQVQLWQRELRRMVASVGEYPVIRFFDDLTAQQSLRHLPVVHCRECGAMGWATLVQKARSNHFSVSDLRAFYQRYFSKDPRIAYFYLKEGGPEGPTYWLNTDTLVRQRDEPDGQPGDEASSAEKESGSTAEYVEIVVPENTVSSGGNVRLSPKCPCCDQHGTVSIVGFQAATLTATYITQLFASRHNDDKKLLAFSDSVQDAAHRAGFFGARSWPFNLRLATQRVVDHYIEQHRESANADLPLQGVADVFEDYWRKELGSDAVRYVSAFIPPDMEWLRDWDAVVQTGKLPAGSNLAALIKRRINWEICVLYGLRDKTGRSLSRAGVSAAYVDPGRLEPAVEDITEELKNHIGGLGTLDRRTVHHIVLGMLSRLRSKGGIFHPELPDDYLQSGGSRTYMFTKRVHMPPYSPHARLPSFLTTVKNTRRFETLLGGGSGMAWHQLWLERNLLDVTPLALSAAPDIWRRIIGRLVHHRVLEERQTGGFTLYGLRMDALLITNGLECVTCDETGERHYVPEHEVDLWDGMPAMRGKGDVQYRREPERGAGLYARLFREGDVHRVRAEEHTGLLDRDRRNEIEQGFKAGTNGVEADDSSTPWAPNLLSCTPTLEMGIDIGALSSAILCSVPPSQANFLQRVGRAGRRDGNSLLLTIATGKPHDLYFFTNPLEMIDGEVATPGVFLNAASVLQRQLTAYCMDEWIEREEVPASAFPTKLSAAFSKLELDNRGRQKPETPTDAFPHNLLQFIDNHRTELLDGFFGLFGDSLTEEAREDLTGFMEGSDDKYGSLPWRILNGLIQQKRDRDNMRKDRDKLTDKIRVLEKQDVLDKEQEKLLSELRGEKRALNALIRSYGDRPTLQFFTDEGLTPNYAFPEAGVSLKSIIWRVTKKQDGEREFDEVEYTYERPARSALVELAPANRFYAGGHHVRVSRVDLRGSELEPWRFCNRCHHSEMVAGSDNKKACPACGSLGWQDKGQRRTMLKLRQVFASEQDRKSRIGDERDDRTTTFYNRQMLVSFGQTAKGQAWYVTKRDLPFGFEFGRRSSFREINFGEYSDIGDKLAVAGEESVRTGFRLCKGCGTVQPRNAAEHTGFCIWRNNEDAAEYEEILYLYREFESEAVRLLLPFVNDLGYEKKLHSFVAAMEMGLREHFGGRIDHLESTVYSEPIPDSTSRKQYLVVYDTVPGGTGYLRELVREPETMFRVLQLAVDRMKHCPCRNEPDKDGCYRCIFAYRHSYDMPSTSRTAALEELGRILKAQEDLEPVTQLATVSVSGLVDSVLERRFLEAIRRKLKERNEQARERRGGAQAGLEAGDEAVLKQRIVRNRPGYWLKIGGVEWEIEPQVDLQASHGVISDTTPDFVFWPARSGSARRPVAVYTDGWQFHENKIGSDLFKRMAVNASQRFVSWTLTYDDVESAFGNSEDGWSFDVIGTATDGDPVQAMALKLMPRRLQPDFGPLLQASSLDLLLAYLEAGRRQKSAGGDGNNGKAGKDSSKGKSESQSEDDAPGAEEDWQKFAMCQALAPMSQPTVCGRKDHAQLRAILKEEAPFAVRDAISDALQDDWLIATSERAPEGFLFQLVAAVASDAVQSLDANEVRIFARLDDVSIQRDRPEYRSLWNGMWRAFNLLQLIGQTYFVTSTSKSEWPYGELVQRLTSDSTISDAPDRESWDDLKELLVDVRYEEVLDGLQEAGVPRPEVGVGLADSRGHAGGGQAEVAWPAHRIALIESAKADEAHHQQNYDGFTRAGWSVRNIDEYVENPAALAEWVLKAIEEGSGA